MPSRKAALVGALALALGLTPLQPVAAAPMAPLPPGLAKAEAGSAVTQVRRYRSFHRHHHHHGHHHGHRGRNLAIGLGIGIIGGIIASEAYRSAPGYYYEDEAYDVPPGSGGDPRALCAQTFRSFEWNTGLYTTYAGEKRLCPYLR
jgi:hypothetical protein